MKYINLVCPKCNIEFVIKAKVYNFRSKKEGKQFFCSKKCCIETFKSKIVEKSCLFCKKTFIGSTKRGDKNCCSIACSKKYAQSFIDKSKMSDSMKKYWDVVHREPSLRKPKRRNTYNNVCTNCSTRFTSEKKPKKTCCNKCTTARKRFGASKSVMSQGRRSKNEIYFANLCKSHFSNVLTNSPIFNKWDADVILSDEKIAILWNGAWHYKQIGKLHSLKQT